MKFKILVLALFFSSCFTGVSQKKFHHHIGIQTNIVSYQITTYAPDLTFAFGFIERTIFTGINYKGSLAFDINDKVNFAVSTYPFFGIDVDAFNSNNTDDLNSKISVEVPVLAELYFGYGKMDDASFYIGSGFSSSYLKKQFNSSILFSPTMGSGMVFGLCASVGSQFFIGTKLISFRFNFTKGLNYIDVIGPSEVVKNNFYNFNILYQLNNKVRRKKN